MERLLTFVFFFFTICMKVCKCDKLNYTEPVKELHVGKFKLTQK